MKKPYLVQQYFNIKFDANRTYQYTIGDPKTCLVRKICCLVMRIRGASEHSLLFRAFTLYFNTPPRGVSHSGATIVEVLPFAVDAMSTHSID